MTRPAGDRRPGILCVTDRLALEDRDVASAIRAAIRGGADMVQLREKDLRGGELLRLARESVAAAKEAGGRCRVLVNDRLDVALAAKASGVHLPAQGLPIAAVRRHAPRTFAIGRSVHSRAEARQAEKEGADYLLFGPVFATPSKAAFGPPHGPDGLRRVVESVRCPVWAIGGINRETIGDLRGIPLGGVAAITAIISAPDPSEAVRELRALLEKPG